MTTDRDANDYLAKALESLASAESELAADRYNACMNRCYFACFQAAVSALVREGIVSSHVKHTHMAVARDFNNHLIRRRKLYPERLASVLPRLVSLRHQADYRPTSVGRGRASAEVVAARDFVSQVASRAG